MQRAEAEIGEPLDRKGILTAMQPKMQSFPRNLMNLSPADRVQDPCMMRHERYNQGCGIAEYRFRTAYHAMYKKRNKPSSRIPTTLPRSNFVALQDVGPPVLQLSWCWHQQ